MFANWTTTIRHFTFIIAALFICSCKKDIDASKEAEPAVLNSGVYVSGFSQSVDTATTALVWKERGNVFLKASIASAITSKGKDLYVAGNSAGKPVYWKNGVMTKLQPARGNAINITGIAVSGDDVYVTGWFSQVYPGEAHDVYWKNGLITELPVGSSIGNMAISGNDIYMVGRKEGKPVYWKNGIAVDLQFASNMMAVSGSDLYFISGKYDPQKVATVPVYYKNSVMTYLDKNAVVADMFVKGTDVYIAGEERYSNYGAVYWKNGVMTKINSPSANSALGWAGSAKKIIVDDENNIYVLLEYHNKNNTPVVAYSKNGTIIELSDKYSYATGMTIIK